MTNMSSRLFVVYIATSVSIGYVWELQFLYEFNYILYLYNISSEPDCLTVYSIPTIFILVEILCGCYSMKIWRYQS